MKILALSDTHGYLPQLDLDGIDIVLHAGDYTGMFARDDISAQLAFFENQFCPWVRRIADEVPHFYYVNGNHKVFYERLNISNTYNDVTRKHLLNHTGVILEKDNLVIWGFPYTNRYGNWAFNVDDTPESMGRLCQQIPTGTHILLSHGPPYGVLDYVSGGLTNLPCNAGSKELAKAIERIKPKLVVCGHLHSNYGVVDQDGVKYVGCSLMNENYKIARSPIVVEL